MRLSNIYNRTLPSLFLISLTLTSCVTTTNLVFDYKPSYQKPKYVMNESEPIQVTINVDKMNQNIMKDYQALGRTDFYLDNKIGNNIKEAVLDQFNKYGYMWGDFGDIFVEVDLISCDMNYYIVPGGFGGISGQWKANSSFRITYRDTERKVTNIFFSDGTDSQMNFFGLSDAQKAFNNSVVMALARIDWRSVFSGSQGTIVNTEVTGRTEVGSQLSNSDVTIAKARLEHLQLELQMLWSKRNEANDQLIYHQNRKSPSISLITTLTSEVQTYDRLIYQKDSEIKLLIIQLGNK